MPTTRICLARTAWVSAGFCAILLACGTAASAASPQPQAKAGTAVVEAARDAVPAAGPIYPQHSVQDVAEALQGRLDRMLPQDVSAHGH